MSEKYQFCIDGRKAGPKRNTRIEAEKDAYVDGYASRVGSKYILFKNEGAEIKTIMEENFDYKFCNVFSTIECKNTNPNPSSSFYTSDNPHWNYYDDYKD